MSTEQATAKLARIWHLGGWDAVATQLAICQAHSRAWNWGAANDAMRQAYRLLGADAPEVPVNAIHRGEHPVQGGAQ